MTQYYLASLYRALKDYSNSEKYYKLELENSNLLYQQNPNAETCYNLAINYWNLLLLYADMQNMEGYDSCIENALKLFTILYESGDSSQKPLVIELKSRKVWRLLQNNDVDVAIPLAEETYAMDESNEQSKYYLAQCYNTKSYEYAKNSDYINAHLIIDKAISICSGNPIFYDSKGELYLMQNKESEALEMWRKVISLYPNYLDYYPNGTNLSNGLKKLGLIE